MSRKRRTGSILPLGFRSENAPPITREAIEAAIAATPSMAAAATHLGMDWHTFRIYATKYELFNPNTAGKGIAKKKSYGVPPLDRILDNAFPEYDVKLLYKRLIDNKLLPDRCAMCGFDEARVFDSKRPLTVAKISDSDGVYLSNLHIICLNCDFLMKGRGTAPMITPTLTPTSSTPDIPFDVSPFLDADELAALLTDLRKS